METKAVLKKLAKAHRRLAELKGIITSIPNQAILLETLTLREAKESSAIENIISTFDEVYQSNLFNNIFASPAAKEVHQYAAALKKGFELVKQHQLLTNNHIIQIQAVVEQNKAGLRKLPGTKLLNDKTGQVVYTPPQDYESILSLMNNLETFINDETMMDADPLVKIAIIHHQFESIHPFYDGNGRTGRIVNILYLVKEGLLHLPVLYLSHYIIQHKSNYYRLLQEVRDKGEWEEWVLFMLEGIEKTAAASVTLIASIKELMLQYKLQIRTDHPKLYSQDLLNNLFKYPYTKIEFLQKDLQISRSTAIRYLDILVKAGILTKHKVGRDNFFLNAKLFELLASNS
ncbi:MAG TPA: Fic/DOC family N-terminal domain-containing protein [Ferruginibacter sp.]|nr:Fic/DOC family N-terminal domain-containing protein [Ferruginibacter sp.]HMP22306.1 Fic/DOC family N-terminal domain-containing protein [Ferruginibacter sp.]